LDEKPARKRTLKSDDLTNCFASGVRLKAMGRRSSRFGFAPVALKLGAINEIEPERAGLTEVAHGGFPGAGVADIGIIPV